MALSKVVVPIRDGSVTLFDMIFAAQADADRVAAHALVALDESLIDPPIKGQFPATIGVKAAALSLAVALATEDRALFDGVEGQLASLGLPADAAAAADTTNASLIAHAKRRNQRLTSLIALFPPALTGSGNLKTASLEPLVAGEAHIGAFGGHTTNPAFTQFARLADTTTYGIGDLVANDTNGSNVVPLSFTVPRVAAGSFLLTGCRLRKSTAVVTNAAFRLHLYHTIPTILAGAGNGDNAVFATVVTGAANHIGALDVNAMMGHADGAVGYGAPDTGGVRGVKLASGSTVWGLIEARGAYGPGSAEAFNGYLETRLD